jgi:hypothetical protein
MTGAAPDQTVTGACQAEGQLVKFTEKIIRSIFEGLPMLRCIEQVTIDGTK